jgi:molybdopterin synthase catalytic subunit
MANPVCEVLLTKERLKAPKEIVDPNAGAMVDFWGVVRELEDGREIKGIEYEAHEKMAKHQMREIARRAKSDFGLHLAIVHHRIGFVAAGEASLFLRVVAKHRQAAFRANQWMVEELKKRVPIWKSPQFKIDNRSRGKAGVSAGPVSIPSKR